MLSKAIYFPYLLVLILICSCASDKIKPPVTDIYADSIPSNESFNAKVVFSDSGTVKAVLYAGRIRVFSKQNYTLIDGGAKVDFFKHGEYASTLTGVKGKIFDVTKDVEVYDSVKLVSDNGSVLMTNRLYWVNKTQRIKTDDFVKIKTSTEEVQGYGFESDQNLKDYVIYKVSGEVLK